MYCSKSRQKLMGEKIKRRNNDQKNATIADLKSSLSAAEKREKEKDATQAKLEAKIRQLEEEKAGVERQLEDTNKWVKPTYSMMSSSGKKEFRRAAYLAKDTFPAGTNRALRKLLGINLSIAPTPPSAEENKLKVAIREFARENSFEIPNKKGKDIRYHSCYKSVLYYHFLTEQSLHCAYQTFCKWWPSNIIQPKVDSFDRYN